MTERNAVQSAETTGIMPISLAVKPNPITSTTATPGPKKDLDYYRKEFEKANIQFYRATRLIADLVLDARLNLSPEEFEDFMTNEVQFDYSTIRKLIKTASSFTLNDPKNQLHLPDAWTLRYEIMLMAESTFRIGVTTGIIHKDCNLEDLKRLREQIEGKKGKSKKTTPKKATPETTAPSSRSAAETPQDASVPAETSNAPESEPEAPKRTEAAVTATSKVAPLQMPKKPVESVRTKSRIAVYLAPETAEKNRDQIAALQADLGRLVAKYPFIESFEMADAA